MDTFPCRRDFDQYTITFDTDGFVESDEGTSFRFCCFLVEGEAGVDFGGDAAGYDFEDFFAEFDELSGED